MKSLDDMLNRVEAPEPSDTLKARILRDAKAQRPAEMQPVAANDNRWKKWSAIAAAAIILGVVGVTTLTLPTETADAELWAETAEDMGYEDLYAWVNDADDSVEDQDQSLVEPYSVPA